MPDIKITSNGGRSTIWVNGIEQSQVRSFSLTHKAGELPSLTLETFAMEMTVDVDGAQVEQVAVCAHCKQRLAEVWRTGKLEEPFPT